MYIYVYIQDLLMYRNICLLFSGCCVMQDVLHTHLPIHAYIYINISIYIYKYIYTNIPFIIIYEYIYIIIPFCLHSGLDICSYHSARMQKRPLSYLSSQAVCRVHLNVAPCAVVHIISAHVNCLVLPSSESWWCSSISLVNP